MFKDRISTPKPGNILLSEPFLKDSNFIRTVLLLCEHGNAGSVGFISEIAHAACLFSTPTGHQDKKSPSGVAFELAPGSVSAITGGSGVVLEALLP